MANFEAALSGKLDKDYPNLAKIVRIFTSSTFTDTGVERNSLMENVYPKLKTYCQERGYEFQVVDMRWGVRDESTTDHMTSELCMRELRECQRLSTGPNFITFLAQKYGYRPFPVSIGADDFEKMLGATSQTPDQELLEKWFKKDENCSPEMKYNLQPITDLLPNYSDVENTDEKKKQRDSWWEDFESIQLILRSAADKVFKDSQEKRHLYYMSVTEDEITRGILNADDTRKHCYWFKRTITDIMKNQSAKKFPRFMDAIKGKVDEEAKKLLNRLKDELIPAKLREERILKYEVEWTEEGINPKASKKHKEYIDKFMMDFKNKLTDMIDVGIKEKSVIHQMEESKLEVIRHVTFAKEKCLRFCGREKLLEDIRAGIEKVGGKPLVIHGTTGSGKSALMAKVAESIPQWYKGKDVAVIVRFVGTTMSSSGVRQLLLSLCQQLVHFSTEALPEGINKKPLKDLIKSFTKLLKNIKKGKEVFLLLDSLDQLDDSGDGRDMEWLPIPVKSNNIRVILSTLPDEEYKVAPILKRRIDDSSCFIEVKQLDEDDRKVILKDYLGSLERTLTPDQMKIVMDMIAKNAYPLYLKLAVDEAARWKSYSSPDMTKIEATVPEVIEALFKRLEKYHGKLLVSHALGYITASKAGLSEAELEDILSCDDEVLNDVYQYAVPPVRRLPPLLWVRVRYDLREYLTDRGSDGVQVINWYHRQFIDAATQRYLGNNDERKKYNAAIAEYFIGTWAGEDVKKSYKDKRGKENTANRHVSSQPLLYKDSESDNVGEVVFNHRKLSELPYNLIMCGDLEKLKIHVFCNMMWMYEKVRASGIDGVLDDFELAKAHSAIDKDIETVWNALKLSSTGIIYDYNQIPLQFVARINTKKASLSKYLKDFIQQAEKVSFTCLIPRQGFLSLGDGKMVRIAGHEIQMMAFSLSENKNKVVTAAMDDIVRISDADSGRSLKTWSVRDLLETYHPDEVLLCRNDEILVLCWRWMIHFIDVLSGNVLENKIEFEQEEGFHQVPIKYYPKKSWLLFLTDSKLVAYDLKEMCQVAEVPAGKYPPDDKRHHQQKEYFQLVGSTVMIKRPGNARVMTGDIEDIILKNGQFNKFAINSEPDKWIYHVTMTPCKKVVCVCYSSAPIEPGKMNTRPVKVMVFNDGKVTKEFNTFDITFPVGSEKLMDGEDDCHVLFNNYESVKGGSAIYSIDINTGKHTVALQETGLINNVEYFGKGRLCEVNAYSATVVDIKDIPLSEEGTSSSGGEDSEENLVTSSFSEEIENVTILPSTGRYAAFADRNLGLHVWDIAEMKLVRSMNCRNAGIYSSLMAFPTASTAVSIDGQKNLVAFDLKTLDKFGPHDEALSGKPQTESFCVIDSQHAIGPCPKKQNIVNVYNFKTGKAVSSLKCKDSEKVQTIKMSGNGQVAFLIFDKHVGVWDTKKKSRLPDLKHKELKFDVGLSMAVSHEGKYFVADDKKYSQNFVIWDTATGKGKEVAQKTFHGDAVSVAFSRKLQAVVVGYNSGDIGIYSLKKQPMSLDTHFKPDETVQFVNSPRMSEDGSLMAFHGGQNTTVVLVDLEKRARLATVTLDSQVWDWKFSRDNNFFLIGASCVKGPLQFFIHRPKEKKTTFDQALAGLSKKDGFFGGLKKKTFEYEEKKNTKK